ncbi:Septation initiation network scaffold protein cdc11 [Trametes pubescens]|uniref:Septation initiation network scaffold protein cdc11 n=1 Tax=Trametes pubescens TaxID=154538 RepID=A0A1M2VWS9_TRAPU|nr:Septation initiation network scaffold protein cdc11 [Trametes pubescens]
MASGQPKPAWLTDELADVDEWVDWQDEEQSIDSAHSGSDLSLTQPLGSVLVRNNDLCSPSDASKSADSAGTFIVREDMPQAPLLPKTPGRNKKALVKDFFSPLALEKMFEPPSPPHPSSSLPPPSLRATAAVPTVPSRLSQVYVPPSDHSLAQGDEEELPNSVGSILMNDVLEADGAHGQFTFSVPRPSPFNPAGPVPEAQSTPGPNVAARHLNAPPTDPRLRLFQFQYDTFTRDHLSAMVDSIAVNTPSGEGIAATQGSRQSTPSGLSPVAESSFTRLRSAKRIKLSPASDYSSEKGDGAAIIIRPESRKDYVGESRNLMEQIRKARDFSTVSTVATAKSPAADRQESPEVEEQAREEAQPPLRRPSFLAVPDNGSSRDPSPAGTLSSGKQSTYSSLAFRQQAASLMAQIRSDMKGAKRIFSGDTEASHLRDDTTEASAISADTTVPSLRTRGGDFAIQSRPRQLSSSQAQMRRTSATVNRVSSTSRGKQRERAAASPRKSPRHQRVESAGDAAKDLAEDFTRLSFESSHVLGQFPAPPVRLVSASTSTAPPSPIKASPGLLAPPTGDAPAYPTSSLRTGRNADLTRFVSSSTASGTTVTVGSTESFVKHAGPKQITHITPNDVPALPERVGKMVFDRVMMRWVKATALATGTMSEVEEHVTQEYDGDNSEDPFRDIESLREDDSGADDAADEPPRGEEEQEESMFLDNSEMDIEKSRFEVLGESEVEDAEEAELTSFSTDGPSQDYIPAMPAEDEEQMDEFSGYTDDTVPDDEGEGTEGMVPTATIDLPLEPQYSRQYDEHTVEPAFDDTPPQRLAPAVRPSQHASVLATPNPPSRSASGMAPTSAPRSVLKSASITPVSALKDPGRSRFYTPATKLGHRRSVSFSDGKREGPIVGVGRNIPTPDVSAVGDDESPLASGSRAVGEASGSAVLVPSARSKRIANMLDDLGDDDFEDDSPSKASSASRPPTAELQPIPPRRPSTGPGAADSPLRSGPRRVSSRVPPTPRGTSGNATFLTECSFGVAHDRLVQVITDVQPFEPYWEELSSIDLSHRNLDSTARLKEFLPRLDSLSLLTGVTSFSHLLNLENLDISHNQIDSLRQLECLRHLRELRADGNHIDSVDGLQKMDGLIKLSLQANEIRELDLHEYKWTRLEMLNLSQNRINDVGGLGSVPSLVALNLDNNSLGALEPEVVMSRLRILRVSGNRLQTLNAAPFPNLRTLYADNNSLGTIVKAYRLAKLENLSLRNQNGRGGLTVSIRDVRDVKRLYLSGNPLKPGFLSEPCYNLVYLELAACRLITLPADFAQTVPNVRVLNLNYNFLEDPSPLEGLTRLRKLMIIGSRIKGAKQLVRVLRGMKDMEMIDFRQVFLALFTSFAPYTSPIAF